MRGGIVGARGPETRFRDPTEAICGRQPGRSPRRASEGGLCGRRAPHCAPARHGPRRSSRWPKDGPFCVSPPCRVALPASQPRTTRAARGAGAQTGFGYRRPAHSRRPAAPSAHSVPLSTYPARSAGESQTPIWADPRTPSPRPSDGLRGATGPPSLPAGDRVGRRERPRGTSRGLRLAFIESGPPAQPAPEAHRRPSRPAAPCQSPRLLRESPVGKPTRAAAGLPAPRPTVARCDAWRSAHDSLYWPSLEILLVPGSKVCLTTLYTHENTEGFASSCTIRVKRSLAYGLAVLPHLRVSCSRLGVLERRVGRVRFVGGPLCLYGWRERQARI